jgi:hypothetical protein
VGVAHHLSFFFFFFFFSFFPFPKEKRKEKKRKEKRIVPSGDRIMERKGLKLGFDQVP